MLMDFAIVALRSLLKSDVEQVKTLKMFHVEYFLRTEYNERSEEPSLLFL